MGRLVVRDVLPGDTQSIDRIMHERDQTMLGGDRRGEDAKFFAVARGRDDLFAPVAENVGAQAWIRLRPVN